MVISVKLAIVLLLLVGIVLVGGCSAPAENPAPPAGQTQAQVVTEPADQPVSQPQAGENPATDNATPVAEQPLPARLNRVDVIYFHVSQRCPTCLCFEKQVNYVIDAYFSDEISSGKLTYRVLNAQQKENADIARKYGAVGSQLFINTVINGEDNIKDIQDIWNWNCRYNTPNFNRRVRSVIDDSLKGIE